MTLHIFLNGIVIDIESTQKIDNYILYVIIASLKSETTNYANRIPDSPLLISSLPGSASRMHVESLGSDSQSLCLANLISKDTHLVFSIYYVYI